MLHTLNVMYVLRYHAKAWESGPKGYLRAFSGAGYVWDRGLGFSPEAVLSWDADVLCQEDKAGPRPSWLDVQEQD